MLRFSTEKSGRKSSLILLNNSSFPKIIEINRNLNEYPLEICLRSAIESSEMRSFVNSFNVSVLFVIQQRFYSFENSDSKIHE